VTPKSNDDLPADFGGCGTAAEAACFVVGDPKEPPVFPVDPHQVVLDSKRRFRLGAAIRCYDWVAAVELARSEQERQDVKDSMSRVAWLETYIQRGDFAAASKLAITLSEMQRIEQHMAAAVEVERMVGWLRDAELAVPPPPN